MPPGFGDEGARAAQAVKSAHPEIGVLLLSQHIETHHVVELVSLGGFGYLLKDRVLDVGEFLAAAERVARGGSALDPQVVAGLVARRGAGDPLAMLTDRERDVLELMAEGLTNSGIAKRLYLSERTVEAHVRHVFTKLSLPETEDGHRRVLAVLTHLSAATQTEAGEDPALDGISGSLAGSVGVSGAVGRSARPSQRGARDAPPRAVAAAR